MFKLQIRNWEVLSGEYFARTVTTFGKSPKQCWAKMSGANHGQRINGGGHPSGYGGMVLMIEETLYKNGKIISQTWE